MYNTYLLFLILEKGTQVLSTVHYKKRSIFKSTFLFAAYFEGENHSNFSLKISFIAIKHHCWFKSNLL